MAYCAARGVGRLPKWPTGADCKSAGLRLRWFESITYHHLSILDFRFGIADFQASLSKSTCVGFSEFNELNEALNESLRGKEEDAFIGKFKNLT
jgi:hypothetical protein